MLVQEDEERYNFDISRSPMNPLTGRPISSWYGPGQTWTGQFADLATTVDECRAELVGAYLMDDMDNLPCLAMMMEVTYDLMIVRLILIKSGSCAE